MKTFGPLFVAVLTVVAMTATTAAHAVEAASRGAGVDKCSEFLDETLGANKDPEQMASYGEWAEGFMTGLNASLDLAGKGGAAEKNLSVGLVDQMTHYAHYCQAHPDAVFELAVLDLYKSLPPYRGR